MNLKTFVLVLLIGTTACTSEKKEKSDPVAHDVVVDSTFNKEKWSVKEGSDYPYRAQMFKDIVYNDTVRALDKDEILGLLGEPDRTNDGHLYYTIAEKRLGSWTLNTKAIVIKIAADNSIEWIKIYE